mgnify:CR=1 FL=1
MEEQKKSNSVYIGTAVALIIAVSAYGFYKYTKKEDATIEPIVITPSAEPTPTPVATTYMYKDGEYTAVGNYNSPGGAEEVGVKITLKNDVVTALTVTPKATRPISVKMQTAVSTGAGALVVGKKLDQVVLDKVSGSSLTPKGFNDAIAKIKVSAKV